MIIGDNLSCGNNTVISDPDWHSDEIRVSGPKPIFKDDNVWLGINIIILEGVVI